MGGPPIPKGLFQWTDGRVVHKPQLRLTCQFVQSSIPKRPHAQANAKHEDPAQGGRQPSASKMTIEIRRPRKSCGALSESYGRLTRPSRLLVLLVAGVQTIPSGVTNIGHHWQTEIWSWAAVGPEVSMPLPLGDSRSETGPVSENSE